MYALSCECHYHKALPDRPDTIISNILRTKSLLISDQFNNSCLDVAMGMLDLSETLYEWIYSLAYIHTGMYQI